MKSPRPLALIKLAALTTLSLLLLALTALAQDSKPLPPPTPDGGGPGKTKPTRHPEGPFTSLDVQSKAVLTAGPAPEIPRTPPDEVTPSGIVRLRAVLSYTGEVKEITVLKSLPGGLNEKAVEAARQIKFTPARKNGRAVSQYVTLEYSFNIYPDEREVTKKVLITEQPQPAYLEASFRNRAARKVVVEAIFCEDGSVASPRVVEDRHAISDGAFEAAARLIKFEPAEVKGRKVSVIRRVEYVLSPDAPAPSKP
jgi:TonB family protein